MKKIIGYFSLILISTFLMMFFVSSPTKAIYDTEKNSIGVYINKNEIRVSVTYQRGFNKGNAKYVWCSSYDRGAGCSTEESRLEEIQFVTVSGYSESTIAKGDASYADNNPTTVTFTLSKSKDDVLNKLSDYSGQTLTMIVNVSFCAVRSGGQNGADYSVCQFWDDKTTVVEIVVDDILNNNIFSMNVGDIEDENVKTMLETISEIVYGTVMPIIWTVLGLFLVVKGAITGVQIVKSADEPQVRQEKIGSLKWLVIGVAIAALASGAVQLVTGYFSGVFGG